MKSVNKCHRCGATSYKAVIKRDGQGVMRPSGEYQCTGCKLVFASVDEWRVGRATEPEASEGSSKNDPVNE